MYVRYGLLVLLLSIACIPVAQTETRPQFQSKTKAIEISVTVSPELRKHPGLFDDLLAEGRKRSERHRADAAQALRETPDFFTDGRNWSFESNYVLRSVVAGRYVSVVRAEQSYSGGAHGNLNEDTILWDRESRKRMNIRPFFRETADDGPTMQTLARLARLAVAAEKLVRLDGESKEAKLTPEQYLKENPEITDGIQPSLLKVGPISLTPSTEPGKSAGFTFHYSPYMVGAYAEGPYTVVVPWTAFREHLSPQGITIFGGNRPENDDI